MADFGSLLSTMDSGTRHFSSHIMRLISPIKWSNRLTETGPSLGNVIIDDGRFWITVINNGFGYPPFQFSYNAIDLTDQMVQSLD